MPDITSETLAIAATQYIGAKFIPALLGNLVMGNLVNRDYEPEINSVGDVVNVILQPQLVANNIAETGTVQTQNAMPGNARIELTTHAEATFKIPDVAKLMTVVDPVQLYLQPAVNALGEKIETDLMNLVVHFANSAGSASAAIDEAAVDAAEQALFDNKVTKGAERYLVLASKPYSTLRNVARFSEFDKIGTGESIVTGAIGQVKGFNAIRSQYAPKVGNVYHGLGFVRDTISLAIRRLPQVTPGTGAIVAYAELATFGVRVVMSYNANTLSQQITVDTLYGAAVIRPEFGVDLQSNA